MSTRSLSASRKSKASKGPVKAKAKTKAAKPSATHGDAMPEKLPTRKARLANTKRAILQSALELFSQNGFEGTSIREVAAHAGVHHAMIRHAYGNKIDLWRDAVGFMFERASAEITGDITGGTPREQFERGIRRYIDYCARHPEHARLMIQLSAASGPDLRKETEAFMRTRHLGSYRYIEKLKESGELPDVDTLSIMMSIVGACQTIFLLAPELETMVGRNVMAPQEIKKHADAVIALFLR